MNASFKFLQFQSANQAAHMKFNTFRCFDIHKLSLHGFSLFYMVFPEVEIKAEKDLATLPLAKHKYSLWPSYIVCVVFRFVISLNLNQLQLVLCNICYKNVTSVRQ